LLNLKLFSKESQGEADPAHGEAVSSEEWLVNQARLGDEEAFVGLVELYWGSIQTYLLRLVGEAEGAADLTQETFYRAYKSIRSLPHAQILQFKPWLYKIATNRAITYSHAKNRHRWLSLDFLKGHSDETALSSAWLIDSSPGPSDYSVASEVSQEVVATLARMPKDQVAVLLLRFYHDLSIEEIGQALNTSPNATRARLHRARLAFRRNYRTVQSLEER
jgi:RNA polymerase sigma-70 factor (ECF subfamily)